MALSSVIQRWALRERYRYGRFRGARTYRGTGRKLRVLTIVDTFSRFSPALYPSGESRLGVVNLAAALTGDRTDVRMSAGKGGCDGDHHWC